MSDFQEVIRELACGGIVLVCGLPGLGKSTLARKISSETGAKLVAVDAIREAYAKQHQYLSGLDCYSKARAQAYGWTAGVVIDACALTPEYRAALSAGPGRRRAAIWIRTDLRLSQCRRPKIADLSVMAARAVVPTTQEGFVFVLEVDPR